MGYVAWRPVPYPARRWIAPANIGTPLSVGRRTASRRPEGQTQGVTRYRPRPAHTRGDAGLRAKSRPHRREYVAEIAEVCAGRKPFDPGSSRARLLRAALQVRLAPVPRSTRAEDSPGADARRYPGYRRVPPHPGPHAPPEAVPAPARPLARTRRLRSATSSVPPTATSCAAVRGLPTCRAVARLPRPPPARRTAQRVKTAGVLYHAPTAPTTGQRQSDAMIASCAQAPRISASRATSAARAAPPACCARTSASQARVASRVVAAPRCRPTS